MAEKQEDPHTWDSALDTAACTVCSATCLVVAAVGVQGVVAKQRADGLQFIGSRAAGKGRRVLIFFPKGRLGMCTISGPTKPSIDTLQARIALEILVLREDRDRPVTSYKLAEVLAEVLTLFDFYQEVQD